MNLHELQYPLGEFKARLDYPASELRSFVEQIAAAPADLRLAVAGLSDSQLDTPYRPEGWTLRQVVHHLPDSHSNAYIRIKLALTEDEPEIRTYHEELWAELPDGRDAGAELSLNLLEALHARWVLLLESLTADDYSRRLVHPDFGVMSVTGAVAMYAWHGRHHIAHITGLRARKGW